MSPSTVKFKTAKPVDAPAVPPRQPSLPELLTDRIGKLALRSAQIIVIVALAAAIVFALVQLKLVVIPLLIAIIIASAAAPILGWLRRRGLPAAAAAWIALVAGIVVIGGLVTLIVFAVRGQWDELADAVGQQLGQ